MTYSGIRCSMYSGEPNLRDIAVQLCRLWRWAGAGRRPWTVGLHSIAVQQILQQRGFGPYVQLIGALHDAHEVLTNDVPSPYKSTEFRQMQDRIQYRIIASLGLRQPTTEESLVVHQADHDAAVAETYLLYCPHGQPQHDGLKDDAFAIHFEYLQNDYDEDYRELFDAAGRWPARLYDILNTLCKTCLADSSCRAEGQQPGQGSNLGGMASEPTPEGLC